MYKILDDFLPESDFRSIQEWADSNKDSCGEQEWQRQLLVSNDGGVEINQPKIKEGYNLGETYSGATCLKVLVEKIIDHLNSLPQTYEFVPRHGRVTETRSSIFRFGYGSGILIHRDSNRKNNDSARYGISYYLNDVWENNWGGELVVYGGGEDLYSDEADWEASERSDVEPVAIIKPKPNRLAIIKDDWHKVNLNLNRNIDRVTIQTFIIVEQ